MKVGEKIWHAVRTSFENEEIPSYGTPTQIVTGFNKLSVMPATSRGYLELMKYGEKASDVWTVIANAQIYKDTFHEGDVMWVDGEKPIASVEVAYGNGASANAVIKNVSTVNRTINITLERNQRQVK